MTEASVARTYHWREDPFLSWRVATHAALLVAAVAAWVTTAALADAMPGAGSSETSGGAMSGGDEMAMSMEPAGGSLILFLLTWLVMMAAMMFPSVAPMVATFVSVQRGRRLRGMASARGGTGLFLGGYLMAWSAIGLVVAALPWVGDLAGGAIWREHARWLVSGTLVAAAVYELTPWKQACLRRCRGPMAFVVHSWRNGHAGALRMGLEHGSWCVGCCWALMAGLVALGLMSLSWMALVALLIAVEKLLPWRRVGTGAVTAALLGLAGAVVAAPALVGTGLGAGM